MIFVTSQSASFAAITVLVNKPSKAELHLAGSFNDPPDLLAVIREVLLDSF